MSGTSVRRFFTAGIYLLTGLVFAAESLSNRVIDLEGKGAVLLPKIAGLGPALRTESQWDIVYTALIVLSTVALITFVRGRGSLLVTVGGAITLIGNLAHSAVVVIQVVAANMTTQDPASMARLWDSVNNDSTLLPIVLMVVIFPLGGIIMAAGLARARVVGWWVIAAWAVATVLDLVLQFPGSHSILAVIVAVVIAYTAARIAFPPHVVADHRMPAAA